MKKLIILAVILLSGCTTNGVYDPVKTWTLVGIVAVGGIAASDSSDTTDNRHCGFVVTGSGSTPIHC